jgi:hypothetical protein
MAKGNYPLRTAWFADAAFVGVNAPLGPLSIGTLNTAAESVYTNWYFAAASGSTATVTPAAAVLQLNGRLATISGAGPVEATITPASALLSIGGLAPAASGSVVLSPAAALVGIAGRVPALAALIPASPATAPLAIAGRAASLLTQTLATPEPASLSLQTLAATVSDGSPGVELTIEPAPAVLSLDGLLVTTEETLNHAHSSSRRRGTYGPVLIEEPAPQPPVVIDPRLDAPRAPGVGLLIDTTIAARRAMAQTDEEARRRAKIRARRRAEEETIAAYLAA